ncbi:hypothetical protein KDK95_15330 [Actinospica sp. MGRD01-02]|uniref:Uncharacterized protein n=1 Tax=Actinospica acidithermotolerans TaxID=2828514 RepID=A0A941E7C0_9ACTN|nr:hypothetical protein [Actinospica acidithermotolerans]MBR7827690.1 hypothetical protein [Actinospica acidithermotolerans]
MAFAQVFERVAADAGGGAGGRRAALAAVGGLTLGDAPPRTFEPIAVPEPLAPLLPGGIRRGEALGLPGDEAAGRQRGRGPAGAAAVDYLTLALLAGALRQGLWCAAVGVRGLGGAALAGLLGAEALRAGALQRLLVVAGPGERWAEIATVLADGVDLVLLAAPDPVPAQLARRVDARLRQGAADESRHRAALLVLGAWPGARTVLRVRRLGWTGFDAGTGHLVAGQAVIDAEDRARRRHTVQVLLPGGLGPEAPLSVRAPADLDRNQDRDRGRDWRERPAGRLTAVA